MPWENDRVLEIVEGLGQDAALWLLALSDVRGVGTGRARNYHVFPGKIKSTAKELGIDVPQEDKIRDGFDRLKRVKFATSDGRTDTVILGDKPDYVKLTDHGLTLVKLIDSKPDLQQDVKEFLGAVVEQEEEDGWWPDDIPSGAPVQLTAISAETQDWPCELETVAEFSCPHSDCDEDVNHAYKFVYPNEAWTKDMEVKCPGCEQGWKHAAGDPWDEPEPVS